MKMKLRMQPDDVLAQAVSAVKMARQFTDNVEFSPEDAGRSEIDFLCRVIEAVGLRSSGRIPSGGQLLIGAWSRAAGSASTWGAAGRENTPAREVCANAEAA